MSPLDWSGGGEGGLRFRGAALHAGRISDLMESGNLKDWGGCRR